MASWKNESIFKGSFKTEEGREKHSTTNVEICSYGLKPLHTHASARRSKSTNCDTTLSNAHNKECIKSSIPLESLASNYNMGYSQRLSMNYDAVYENTDQKDNRAKEDWENIYNEEKDEKSSNESSTSYKSEEEEKFSEYELAATEYVIDRIFACLGSCKAVFSKWKNVKNHMKKCNNIRKDEFLTQGREEASKKKARDLLISETRLTVSGKHSPRINTYIKWLKTGVIDKVRPNMLQLHVNEDMLYSALRKFHKSYLSQMKRNAHQWREDGNHYESENKKQRHYKDQAMQYLLKDCGWSKKFSNYCVGPWEEFIEDYNLTVS